MIISVIEQGLIFGILALGVYITYRILDFPDLTVDGSIVLGASMTAMLITRGVNPIVATLISLLCGSISGLFTGILHVHLKISNLLSGILVMIGLYSINLRIMTKPNIQFFKYDTIFTMINIKNKMIVLLLIVILVKLLMDLFFKTKRGMMIKVTGDNPQLVTSLGESIGQMKIIGLMISNGLVGLSGSLLSQYQRFTDINGGNGIIVIGLASVIIGQSIFKLGKNIKIKSTTMVVMGAILYKGSQAITLQMGLNANDFKLISALLIIMFLGVHHLELGNKIKKVQKLLLNRGEVKC